jgi:hypothetical protein
LCGSVCIIEYNGRVDEDNLAIRAQCQDGNPVCFADSNSVTTLNFTYCAPLGCTNTDTDIMNCGRCGNESFATLLNTICEGGTGACAQDYGACVNEECSEFLPNNPFYCGSCTVECQAPTSACDSSACYDPTLDVSCGNPPQECQGGTNCCNNECVDYQTDNNNCGGCGQVQNICDTSIGETCTNGACIVPVPEPTDLQTSCGTPPINCLTTELGGGEYNLCCPSQASGGHECVDTSQDYNRCGSCTAGCSGQEVCYNGTCYLPSEPATCGSPPQNCGSLNCSRTGQGDGDFGCKNIQTDPLNCGSCLNDCQMVDPLFTVCNNATCGPPA